MNKVKIFSSMVLLVLLFLVPVTAQTQGADTTSPAPGLTSPDTTGQAVDTLSQKSVDDLQKDYKEINKQYLAIRKQALKDIKVGELSDKWNKKLENIMVEKDSTTKSKFALRDKVSAEFEKARTANNKDEIARLQKEYRDIMVAIQKIQQKVLEDDSLRQEYKSVEDAILNKMLEINPEAPELKKKLESISLAIQNKQEPKQ